MNRGLEALVASLQATNVISDEYQGHLYSLAEQAARVAYEKGKADERQRHMRAFDGMIDPDGYDEETVRELMRRIFPDMAGIKRAEPEESGER